MKDLRTWGQGLRTEGLDWTGLEGLGLEGLTGSAAGRGRPGLALSGDLIRGGPGRKTPPIDFRNWVGCVDTWMDCTGLSAGLGRPGSLWVAFGGTRRAKFEKAKKKRGGGQSASKGALEDHLDAKIDPRTKEIKEKTDQAGKLKISIWTRKTRVQMDLAEVME